MSSSSSRPPSKLYDLDITIVSAKHLKNCNWRQGDLKPYVSFSIEPGRRFTTKTDEAGSTRPVWNERFVTPINGPIHDSLLSIEINHSGDASLPTKLVGSVQFPLRELLDSDYSEPIQTLKVLRPSGRHQGKLRVKLSLREKERERERPSPPPQDYQFTPTPPPNYYYSTAPPPPPRDYRGYSQPPYAPHIPPPSLTPEPSVPPSPYSYSGYSSQGGPYSGYYAPYYSQLPPPPRPSFFDQGSSYGGQGGPSAPVDYSSYDQRAKASKMGLGTGLAVGAVAGALGGLVLEEGLKHEEEKIAERVHDDLDARDDYNNYRANY